MCLKSLFGITASQNSGSPQSSRRPIESWSAAKELRAGFESHELFEEEILYPEFDQFLSTKVAIGDAFEAHAELDGLLQEIEGTPANNAGWIERIRELKSRMQEHMRAEEEKIFPVARLELAKTRAEELGRRFQERQK